MGPPKKNAPPRKSEYKDKEKPTMIRFSNIEAAKGNLFTMVTVSNCQKRMTLVTVDSQEPVTTSTFICFINKLT